MDQKLSYESFFMTQTFYYELFNGANKQLGKYWYLDQREQEDREMVEWHLGLEEEKAL